MPILVAPFVTLSIGIFLGLRGASALGARGAAVARRCVLWLAALAFLPAIAFPALYRPAWAWLHIDAAARLPSSVNLVAAALASAVLVLGHLLGSRLGALATDSSPRSARPGLVAAIIPAAFAGLVLIVLWRRVAMLEPARRTAEAVTLFESRFAIGLAIIDVLLAVGCWLTLQTIAALQSAAASGRARSRYLET